MRKFVIAVCVAIAISVTGALPAQASSSVGAINASRSANGLGNLTNDSQLAGVAAAWSRKMAESGDCSSGLRHNPNYSGQMRGGWSRAAENVACGTKGSNLHAALMNSSGHRANILGDFTHAGVGVVEKNGIVWVTQVFGKYGQSVSASSGGSGGSSSSGSSGGSASSGGSKSSGGSSSGAGRSSGPTQAEREAAAQAAAEREARIKRVTAIQENLIELGYADEVGEVDGDAGPMTTAAIEAFQADAGHEVTGAANEKTLEHTEAKLDEGWARPVPVEPHVVHMTLLVEDTAADREDTLATTGFASAASPPGMPPPTAATETAARTVQPAASGASGPSFAAPDARAVALGGTALLGATLLGFFGLRTFRRFDADPLP